MTIVQDKFRGLPG